MLSTRKKLVFALVVFCLAAIAGEATLRWWQPQIVVFANRYFRLMRPTPLGDDFIPGSRVHFHLQRDDGTVFLDFTVHVDRHGLRCGEQALSRVRALKVTTTDYETFEAPNDNVPTIHCIGDSFTMGWGVDFEESYPAYLHRALGAKYDVLNLGVVGIGLRAAIAKSRSVESQLGTPNAIIYLAENGDFADDRAVVGNLKDEAGNSFGEQAFYGLFRRSYVACVPLAIKVATTYQGMEELPAVFPTASSTEHEAAIRRALLAVIDGWSLPDNPTFRALYRLLVRCRTDGIRLILVIPLIEFDPNIAFLIRWCEENEVEYTTFLPSADEILRGDHHFNAKGNRRLADRVAARFFGNG